MDEKQKYNAVANIYSWVWFDNYRYFSNQCAAMDFWGKNSSDL